MLLQSELYDGSTSVAVSLIYNPGSTFFQGSKNSAERPRTRPSSSVPRWTAANVNSISTISTMSTRKSYRDVRRIWPGQVDNGGFYGSAVAYLGLNTKVFLSQLSSITVIIEFLAPPLTRRKPIALLPLNYHGHKP